MVKKLPIVLLLLTSFWQALPMEENNPFNNDKEYESTSSSDESNDDSSDNIEDALARLQLAEQNRSETEKAQNYTATLTALRQHNEPGQVPSLVDLSSKAIKNIDKINGKKLEKILTSSSVRRNIRQPFNDHAQYIPCINSIERKQFLGNQPTAYYVLSSNDRYCALYHAMSLSVCDVTTNEIVSNILIPGIRTCHFLPGQSVVVIIFSDSTVSLWDFNQRTMIGNVPFTVNAGEGIHISDDGRYIVKRCYAGMTNNLQAWNTKTQELTTIQTNVSSVMFMPNSHTLVLSNSQELIIINLDQGTQTSIAHAGRKTLHTGSQDGRYCVLTLNDSTLMIYDIVTLTPILTTPSPVFFNYVLFTPNNAGIFIGTSSDRLELLDLSGNTIQTITLPHKDDFKVTPAGIERLDAYILSCIIDYERQQLLVLSSLGFIYIYDANTGEYIKTIYLKRPSCVASMYLINHGSQLAVLTNSLDVRSPIDIYNLDQSLDEMSIIEKLRAIAHLDETDQREALKQIIGSEEYQELEAYVKAYLDPILNGNAKLNVALQGPDVALQHHNILARCVHAASHMLDTPAMIIRQNPIKSVIFSLMVSMVIANKITITTGEVFEKITKFITKK